jgi:cysteine desulfurase/selenocysteine lyase
MMNTEHLFDLSQVRSLFPVTGHCVYFNHAGTGPMSVPAQRAIIQCMETYSRQAEFHIDDYFALVREARATVARFINADLEEIAFTHNTSEGIYISLMNLALQRGDTILVMNEVFPAVRYVVEYDFPHVDKEYVDFSGRDPVEVVKANLEKKPKALVIDYVQFLNGETISLEELGRFTREKDIFLVVDGIQGIGALAHDARKSEVDFLACGAAKWLFGPSGAGFLYINKRNFNRIQTQHTGWLGADWKGFDDLTVHLPLYGDARKYELGTRNIIGIQALSANIQILLQYGMGLIQERITRLKSRLRRFLEDSGFDILTPEHGVQSGILSARLGDDMPRLYRLLQESRIITSLRNGYLRFSPHFYNTEDEVDEIISVMNRYLD